MMKKRLISILLVCMVSLMFGSSVLAVYEEPLMKPGPGTAAPVHHYPGYWDYHYSTTNPLPDNPVPLPKPGEHPYGYHNLDSFRGMIQADLDAMTTKLANKYGAPADALKKYMSIAPYSFWKLNHKDQVALKNLMMKMAAKELGISVSKLESELKALEREWVREIMRRTGRTESEVRCMLHRHSHHTLLHTGSHKHHDKHHRYHHRKHGHKHSHGHHYKHYRGHRHNARRHTGRAR